MTCPRRLRLCLVALAVLALPATAFAAGPSEDLAPSAPTGKNWAAPQIASVVLAGVMGPNVASFRPDDALTREELHEAILALGKPHSPPTDPDRLVTMRELDAQLVAAAGLLPSARSIRLGARDAGLEPTDMIGTETVARLLGLRVNHPVGSESLERSPKEPASRAEAAYSLAKLRLLDAGRIAAVRDAVATFAVPTLGSWERQVVSRALRFVGWPYVFAGMSEKTQQLWSGSAPGNVITVPGGFDCSGLVWRVFKTQPFDGGPAPLERAQRADDLRDERRGRVGLPGRPHADPARRRPVLRDPRAEVEAVGDRTLGDLCRQRLVHPLVERRRHAAAARGLVRDEARVGPAAARRGRARGLTRFGCPPPG
jgi:hypothetical protein